MYNPRYLTVPINVRFRNVTASYPSPVIATFLFVSGVFVFIFDSGKICGNENDKAGFRSFPFRFQP
jgi:hypothetical protein